MMPGDRPWVWTGLPDSERVQLMRQLAGWVFWLEHAYQPWIRLPPCWPLHEGLRTELTLFWYWHRWLHDDAEASAVDAVAWHHDLRVSADAWRELSDCQHESPAPHVQRLRAARDAQRDAFMRQALDNVEPPAR